MNINKIDRVCSTFTLLLGGYIAATASSYGYMRGTVPGSGFFPFWTGLIIAGLSLVSLVRSLTGKEVLTEDLEMSTLVKSLAICATLFVFIVTIDAVGMLIGSCLLVLATGWIIHPKWNALFAAKLVVTAIVFALACHYFFGTYLNVPLPTGALGI